MKFMILLKGTPSSTINSTEDNNNIDQLISHCDSPQWHRGCPGSFEGLVGSLSRPLLDTCKTKDGKLTLQFMER